jgi:predicted regulator of Ras-like GTPase activity (Roadblock/LC7/MglB family)
MKLNALKFIAGIGVLSFFACTSNSNSTADADSAGLDSAGAMGTAQSSYVNLNTGESVQIVRDTEKGYYVYSDSRKPVEKDMFFVDVTTNDTLYGSKGVVVNSAVVKSEVGSWTLNEQMIEREGDEVKIKTADGKLKMEGDEIKYKEGEETKVKVDGDETKTKTGNTKTKTEDGETKVKVDD